MDEVWRTVATGAVGLVVGLVLWQAQQGGRRRRRRREIGEELELLAALGDQHSTVVARIQTRLAVKLEQYEPDPADRLQRRLVLAVQAGGIILFAIVQWSFFDALLGEIPLWLSAVIGASSAAMTLLISWFAGLSADIREQDKAVLVLDEGKLDESTLG